MIEDQIYINADVESHELEEAITYYVNKNDAEVKEVVAQCKQEMRQEMTKVRQRQAELMAMRRAYTVLQPGI